MKWLSKWPTSCCIYANMENNFGVHKATISSFKTIAVSYMKGSLCVLKSHQSVCVDRRNLDNQQGVSQISVEEAVSRDDIHAAFICTENESHQDYVRYAFCWKSVLKQMPPPRLPVAAVGSARTLWISWVGGLESSELQMLACYF